MGWFFAILLFNILHTSLSSSAFVFAKRSSSDFWSKKTFNLLRLVGALIGVLFLIAIIFICIFSENRFSDEMNILCFILVLNGFVLQFLFWEIIHLIAWEKKTDILERNVREMLEENEAVTDKKSCWIFVWMKTGGILQKNKSNKS